MKEQLILLKGEQRDEVRGYLLSKAIPIEDLEEYFD